MAQASGTFIASNTWKTDHGVSRVRFRDRTILSWFPRFLSYETGADSGIAHWISDHDGQHSTYCGENHPLVDNRHSISGAPSLVVSNDTLFVAYRCGLNRIHVDHVMFLGLGPDADPDAGCYTMIYECAHLKEKSIADPSIGVIQRENGDHPVLLAGWLDPDRKITIRTLSIDVDIQPLRYTGHP